MTTTNGFSLQDAANGHTRMSNGQIDQQRPLEVVVIGAGLGGLTSALALRRAGHKVTVLERSRLAHEYGAAIMVPPNANGVLKRLGVDAEEAGAVEMRWVRFVQCSPNEDIIDVMRQFTEFSKTGDSVQVNDFTVKTKTWQHKYLLAHRVDLHTQLKNAVTSIDGAGSPVELVTGAPVVDVDPQQGSVILKDGSVWRADLVVGADGIHSDSRKRLTTERPFPSGKSAYRIVLQKAEAQKRPALAEILQRKGELCFWFDTDRRIVMYPTRNESVLNFVCFYPDHGEQSVGDTWNEPGSMEDLLNMYEGFDPRARELLSMADPKTLKVWTLTDMREVEKWHDGRFCLVGDAAHPFLPHQGQGGAQAIEDGVALGVLFPFGTPANEVPERLALYQECRKPRAEHVQEATRQSGEDIPASEKKEHAKKVMSFFDYNCGYDEHDSATQKLREWMYTKRTQAIRRMPLSFVPHPSPRQDIQARRWDSSHSTFVARTIQFKTSRTLLQNLLPTPAYSFAAPDSIACASYVSTTLDKMDWLGGQGYDLWALYLHGVQYKKRDGSVLNGDYLVVMAENLTDPILTGREELGFPKVFSDISSSDDASGWVMKSSWRQAEYLKLALEDLRDEQPPAPPEHDGVFVHKYIPATGKPGVADVEYPVCAPPNSGAKVSRYRSTRNGKIQLHAHDSKALPTLHHMVARLAELPVYEIVSGSVVEGTGVDDFASAYRVE